MTTSDPLRKRIRACVEDGRTLRHEARLVRAGRAVVRVGQGDVAVLRAPFK